MASFGSGSPKLKLYQADGVTVWKTYILPVPNKQDGLQLTWETNAVTKKRVDGTYVQVFKDSTKRYIPKLTIKYALYEEWSDLYTMGTTDSTTPTFEQLLSDLGTYQGRIAISPGGSAPFFRCFLSKNIDATPLKNVLYKGVVLEFTGTAAYSSMVLV